MSVSDVFQLVTMLCAVAALFYRIGKDVCDSKKDINNNKKENKNTKK